jgi:hypothetical protein
MARDGTSWHELARAGMEWHGLGQNGTEWHGLARIGTEWHGLATFVDQSTAIDLHMQLLDIGEVHNNRHKEGRTIVVGVTVITRNARTAKFHDINFDNLRAVGQGVAHSTVQQFELSYSYLLLLIHSMEQLPSVAASCFSSGQETLPNLWNPKVHLQLPATCSYPEPARSNPYPHILKIHLNILQKYKQTKSGDYFCFPVSLIQRTGHELRSLPSAVCQ